MSKDESLDDMEAVAVEVDAEELELELALPPLPLEPLRLERDGLRL